MRRLPELSRVCRALKGALDSDEVIASGKYRLMPQPSVRSEPLRLAGGGRRLEDHAGGGGMGDELACSSVRMRAGACRRDGEQAL